MGDRVTEVCIQKRGRCVSRRVDVKLENGSGELEAGRAGGAGMCPCRVWVTGARF